MTDRRRFLRAGVAALTLASANAISKGTAMAQQAGKDVVPFEVPPIRFDADALAPAITAAALNAHHDRFHEGYAAAINAMLTPYPELADRSIEEILQAPEALPPEVRDAAVDVGGAHASHQFFWKVIGPGGGDAPGRDLAAAMDRDLGGVASFGAAFERAALALDGPGFAYLTLTAPETDRLEIVVLPGNGSVLSIGKPGILVCDLWDHAWAADHPDRAAWLSAFWTIVDWGVCEDRYIALRAGEQPA